LIHPTSAVCATTDTARGEKRLPSEQNQAILKSSGRPLGECRFEAFRDGADDDALGRDAMVFLHSVLQVRRGHDAFYDTAAAAYRAAAPERVWPAMRRRVKRLGWLMLPARLALLIKPKAPELRGAVILYQILFASGDDTER